MTTAISLLAVSDGRNNEQDENGNHTDNALAESIIGLYKAEVIHRRGPWRGVDAVEYDTLEWVDWFNNRRVPGPIGDIPPVEFEQAYYESLQAPAATVGLN